MTYQKRNLCNCAANTISSYKYYEAPQIIALNRQEAKLIIMLQYSNVVRKSLRQKNRIKKSPQKYPIFAQKSCAVSSSVTKDKTSLYMQPRLNMMLVSTSTTIMIDTLRRSSSVKSPSAMGSSAMKTYMNAKAQLNVTPYGN